MSGFSVLLWASVTAIPRLLAAQAPPPVAIENVTVIPMDSERRLPGQTVVVQNGVISTMGPSGGVAIPSQAVRVDGRGKFLIPGLTETHGHLPGGNAPEAQVDRTLQLYLLNGITTVRGMLGHPSQLTWRDEIAQWRRSGPRLIVAGPSFNGSTATDPLVAKRMVEDQKAAGYDLLKIHPGVPRTAFDSMAATAHRLGIPFAGHVPLDVGVHRAIEARYASIDHLDGFIEALIADGAPVTSAQTRWFGLGLVDHLDRNKLPALIEAAKQAGVWVNATETLMQTMTGVGQPDAMLADPALRWVSEAQAASWVNSINNLQNDPANTAERRARFLDTRKWLIKSLHQAGVGMLLGADAPQIGNVPGFSTIRELELLVDAGLSPFEALATGTRNVGQYLKDPSVGTIAVGNRADLLLLDADPLIDAGSVRKLAGIIANGRWISGSEVARQLESYRLR